MKNITLGILAHVDSGKTTLSEAMLYNSGKIRNLGRVDHKNAFLDTHSIERERGITIFSKQAVFELGNTKINLLDTPGHVDFSAETERTLQVLDYCVLVISGTDGVQSHTETLWALLAKYKIPCFIFVNKMDIDGTDKEFVIADLKKKLGENCVDFSDENIAENLAVCNENLMEEFLEKGEILQGNIAKAIQYRDVFPCFFGSALKLLGVDKLIKCIENYTVEKKYSPDFGARIYKVTWDNQGNRLTHMKITGGSLKVRELVSGFDKNNNEWQEKVNQIRIYSGEKFTTCDIAERGTVCAVTGLTESFAGGGLGFESEGTQAILEPVLTYQVILPIDVDVNFALSKFRILEQEDPQLNVVWNKTLKEIHLQLMGAVQLEILRNIVKERFDFDVDFDSGSIVYKETIAQTVFGAGHYEPLKHYAEVHLKLEPLERGKGIILASSCSVDELGENWQNLVLTHLGEKVHTGVLTNSAITDMKITLVAGRSHLKHTEGGDFRQATYRALRHALMKAKSVLLEPIYAFKLEIPSENIGRALTDIGQMGGTYSPPEINGETAVIMGEVPVYSSRDYQRELINYTRGKGNISLSLKSYEKCHNSDEIIREINYKPENDLENLPHSVFCSHGAGFTVNWQECDKKMHIKLSVNKQINAETASTPKHRTIDVSENELLEIFERTYGKIKKDPRIGFDRKIKPVQNVQKVKTKPVKMGKEYLLVDGYNIIFAWEELNKLAKDGLDYARKKLMDMLCNYAVYKNCELILVFDAYKVKGNTGSVENYHNIKVVYTKEAETADMYIEKVTHQVAKDKRVRVATSDGLQQIIIMAHGALRLSASAFKLEVDEAEKELREILKNQNL